MAGRRPVPWRRVAALLVAALLAPTGTMAAAAGVNPDLVPRHSPAGLEREVAFWSARAAADREDSLAHRQLGLSLLLQGRATGNYDNFLNAERVLRRALAVEPGNWSIQVPLAFALAAQHRFGEAADLAAAAVAEHPERAEGWAALGDALFDSGDLTGGAAAYQRLLALGESHFALGRWANVQFAAGDVAVARQTLERALQLAQRRGVPPLEQARTMTRLGESHWQAGELAAAEDWYRKALALWPDGWLPLEHLAEVLLAKGEVAAALAAYQRVLDQVRNPELLVAAGEAVAATGDQVRQQALVAEAEAAWQASLASGDPGHLRAYADFLDEHQPGSPLALDLALRDLAMRQDAAAFDLVQRTAWHAGKTAVAQRAAGRLLARQDADDEMRARAQRVMAGRPPSGLNAVGFR